jgi:choline dehydrogenase-like flavoprotein
VVTVGRPPILLPLGRAVGGTTLVNSATCFRIPAAVLARWRAERGLDELTEAELEPWFPRVERELNVIVLPPDLAGRNAEVVRRAVRALGWSGDYLYRNGRGLVHRTRGGCTCSTAPWCPRRSASTPGHDHGPGHARRLRAAGRARSGRAGARAPAARAATPVAV